MTLVLLDYDDCLAKTEDVALRSACALTNQLLQDLRAPARYDPDTFVDRFPGKTFGLILDEVCAEQRVLMPAGFRESAIKQEELAAIEALRSNLQPTAGAMEALAGLKSLDTEFSIVSSSGLRRLTACLEGTGQAEYFPEGSVFSARDSFGAIRSKPNPDVYLRAMEVVGGAPREFLAVEDSVSGVTAAVSAGVGTVIGNVGALPDDRQQERAQKLFAVGAPVLAVVRTLADLPWIVSTLDQGNRAAVVARFGPDAWK